MLNLVSDVFPGSFELDRDSVGSVWICFTCDCFVSGFELLVVFVGSKKSVVFNASTSRSGEFSF